MNLSGYICLEWLSSIWNLEDLELDQVKSLVLKLRNYLRGGTRLLLIRNLLDDISSDNSG